MDTCVYIDMYTYVARKYTYVTYIYTYVHTSRERVAYERVTAHIWHICNIHIYLAHM